MKRRMAAAVCASLGAMAAGGLAAAQDADDWEFAEDPARQLTVAAARYDNGPGIVVQCREGALAALLVGLPVEAERLELDAARADGRSDVQVWRAAGTEAVFRSSVPSRDIRFMRGGGTYALRSAAGAAQAFAASFDLPAQSDNLDRVLTACGWDLSDDRDRLKRGTGMSLTDRDAEPNRPRRSRSRSIARRGHEMPATPPPQPTARPPIPAEQQVSCIVRNLHLTECRALHGQVAGAPDPADTARRLEGRPVFGPAATAVEGSVFYSGTPEPLIEVERIELM